MAGLSPDALFGLWWADPIAAPSIYIFLVRERTQRPSAEKKTMTDAR